MADEQRSTRSPARAVLEVLAAGTSPERAFPLSPGLPAYQRRLVDHRLTRQGDGWSLRCSHQRRFVRVWLVYLAVCLPGVLRGLAVGPLPGLYVGALAAGLAYVGLGWAWYRGQAHTIELRGAELVVHRFRRPPVVAPVADVTRLSLLDTTAPYRAAVGDWWTVSLGDVRVELADGRTIGCHAPALAPALAGLVLAARPDLEVRDDLPLRPPLATYELTTSARLLRTGNNRSGPLLLLAICLVGYVGTASVIGWLA